MNPARRFPIFHINARRVALPVPAVRATPPGLKLRKYVPQSDVYLLRGPPVREPDTLGVQRRKRHLLDRQRATSLAEHVDCHPPRLAARVAGLLGSCRATAGT